MAYELYAIDATLARTHTARHRRDAPRSRPAQAATQDGVGAASSRARARPGPARYTMNPAQPRVDRGDGIRS